MPILGENGVLIRKYNFQRKNFTFSNILMNDSKKDHLDPYGHISLKLPNVDFNFDASIAKHRYQTAKSK